MTQKNTDTRPLRRRQAIVSALLGALTQLLGAGVLLWLRASFPDASFLSKLLLILAVLDLATLIPTALVLRQRLKEIQGGEEDAARQY